MEGKKTILIVDDDQDFVQLLSARLQANNYHLLFAADAISAVNRAVEGHPDLILLDINLPAGDGFVIMQRLKSIVSLALTPVIVLSANAPKFNAARVRSRRAPGWDWSSARWLWRPTGEKSG